MGKINNNDMKNKNEVSNKESKLSAVWSFIKKIFTHNRCDTCGFTKDDIYVTEILMEGGIMQCTKCIKK